MTEELTKAAQQALACMRGLQRHLGPDICAIEADALERALTQRPAVQEVEHSDQLTKAKRLLVDLHKIGGTEVRSMIETRTGSWFVWGQARASLPAPKQATPAQEATSSAPVKTDAGSVRRELFQMARQDHLTDRDRIVIGAAVSLLAPQQATPEPVSRSVFIAGNKTSMCAFVTRDLADRYVSNFGGMTVVEVPVVGAAHEQSDSSEHLRVIASLGAALRRLSFAAQTSGGTAGPDAELQAAIGQAEQALSFGGIGKAMLATTEPVEWISGVESAAKLIQEKAHAYAVDFGHDDDGSLSFGAGQHAQVKLDHYNSLIELADEVRVLAAAQAKGAGHE